MTGLLLRVRGRMRRMHLAWRHGLWRVFRRFGRSVTVATKQGRFTLPTDVEDPISKALFINREYELDLVSSAMSLVRELRGSARGKGTILDVGANNGVIAIGMLVTGEVDKAIAIEPDPRNYAILRHNARQNRLERAMLCLNYAASDRTAVLQFELSEDNYGDHRVRRPPTDAGLKELFSESGRQLTEIPGDTLDNLLSHVDQEFRRDIAAIWIDVQGYEGYVFAGAPALLATGIPVVSEIWPYGIRRAGMSRDAFCAIVEGTWSTYWVQQGGRFVSRPVATFRTFFDGLGVEGDFDNVVFASE